MHSALILKQKSWQILVNLPAFPAYSGVTGFVIFSNYQRNFPKIPNTTKPITTIKAMVNKLTSPVCVAKSTSIINPSE